MAAHLPVPRLPVLLFVFLAVHVPPTHADPLPLLSTYDVSMCSEPILCGSVEIRYPFYLANTTRETADYSRNFSCGYTDLNISCTLQGQTWTPTIRLDGDDYTVESISYDYDHQIISLVDSDVLIAGACPAVRHQVSFNEAWLQSTNSNGYLTFFFGCPPQPWDHALDDYKIKCSEFKNPPGVGGGDAFVAMTDEQDLVKDCSKVFSVLVRGDLLKAASNNQSNFTSGGYGDVLKRGFELEWSRLTADGCHQCEESNGQCAYSQQREYLGCLCYGGKVANPDCHPAPALAPPPPPAPKSTSPQCPVWRVPLLLLASLILIVNALT